MFLTLKKGSMYLFSYGVHSKGESCEKLSYGVHRKGKRVERTKTIGDISWKAATALHKARTSFMKGSLDHIEYEDYLVEII